MQRISAGILILLLGASAAAGGEGQGKPPTPSEQYEALAKEFQVAANAFYLTATKEEERVEPQARIVKLSPRFPDYIPAVLMLESGSGAGPTEQGAHFVPTHPFVDVGVELFSLH